jgi:hypothetical protein
VQDSIVEGCQRQKTSTQSKHVNEMHLMVDWELFEQTKQNSTDPMKSETAASRPSSLPDEDLSIQPPASPIQHSNVELQFHDDQSYV